MNRIFKIITLFALSALLFCSCSTDANIKAARELTQRVVPQYASDIRFEVIESCDSVDCFELESIGGKLIIRGNNANSMAVGLNHYLRYYALSNVSWFADEPVVVPAQMPQLTEKVESKSQITLQSSVLQCIDEV